MIGLKYIVTIIKEGLGIIIVIALVILFSYFDPFGWFSPRAKIDSTAILVREVKQIGELITAEYYGEAITSWPATAIENALEENTEEMKQIMAGIANDFQLLTEEKELNSNQRMRYYRKHLKEKYSTSQLYEILMSEISTFDAKKPKKFHRQEESAIGLLFEKPEDIMDGLNYKTVSDRAVRESNALKKKDATCIGRGIVRAGFDFSKINERDIHVAEQAKTIYITNAVLKILSVELNPWFIPQRKVKGFEILKLEGRINESDIRQLKAKCKKMIEEQAAARRILDEAKRNGEEALKSFFSLVSDREIDSVVIISDYLTELKLRYDSTTIFSPAQALDVYNKSFLYQSDSVFAVDTASLKSFLRAIKKRGGIIDYAQGVKQHINQVDSTRKEFSFSEIENLFKSDLRLDTTRLIKNEKDRAKFADEYWNLL